MQLLKATVIAFAYLSFDDSQKRVVQITFMPFVTLKSETSGLLFEVASLTVAAPSLRLGLTGLDSCKANSFLSGRVAAVSSQQAYLHAHGLCSQGSSCFNGTTSDPRLQLWGQIIAALSAELYGIIWENLTRSTLHFIGENKK